MTTQIDDYLDVTPEEVPEAVVLTDGVYDFTIGQWRRDKVGEDQKSKVTISLKPTAIVDSELDDEEFEFAENVRLEFWLTEKALASKAPHISMTSWLTKTLGLPEEGVSLRDLLEMTLGLQVRARVKKEMGGKEKDIPQAEVARFLKIED
jgi:hypothetical protein